MRSRRVNAGKGKRALAAELRTKGVDNEVITAALADIDAGAERERAEQLVRDKLRRETLGDDDDAKVTRRLVGMLARRGYSQTMAFDVVKVELAERAGATQGLVAFIEYRLGIPPCSWCGCVSGESLATGARPVSVPPGGRPGWGPGGDPPPPESSRGCRPLLRRIPLRGASECRSARRPLGGHASPIS